ncbi:MAG: SAM-dependent methyltransferase [Woeseia sp.]
MQPPRPDLHSLPPPDDASMEQSARVAASLRAAIQAAGGSIGFGEFMQHALYAPGLGYYTAGARKFGAEGDFVTAPELSPLFARVVARQCATVMQQLDGASILELGAGSGALAEDLLHALKERDALPDAYLILEISADLRERQRSRLQSALPDVFPRIRWLDALPRNFRGVVLANEVADALPVERFRRAKAGVEQLRVAEEAGRFVWQSAVAPHWLGAAVAEIEESLGGPLPTGYTSELSAGLKGWITDIANCVDDALLLFFDYGVARREYYAPDRDGGWLRCHYRHRVHNDPLIYPGIQDLTAWVDFTSIAEAAVAAGLGVEAWLTQAHFLLHGGLSEEFESLATEDGVSRAEVSRQVKLLTLPGEMGEHFKCMALSRGELALSDTLRMADRSHAL